MGAFPPRGMLINSPVRIPEGKGEWAFPGVSRNISIGRLSALGAGGCGFKSRFLEKEGGQDPGGSGLL